MRDTTFDSGSTTLSPDRSATGANARGQTAQTPTKDHQTLLWRLAWWVLAPVAGYLTAVGWRFEAPFAAAALAGVVVLFAVLAARGARVAEQLEAAQAKIARIEEVRDDLAMSLAWVDGRHNDLVDRFRFAAQVNNGKPLEHHRIAAGLRLTITEAKRRRREAVRS
jgi:hypothetical protein